MMKTKNSHSWWNYGITLLRVQKYFQCGLCMQMGLKKWKAVSSPLDTRKTHFSSTAFWRTCHWLQLCSSHHIWWMFLLKISRPLLIAAGCLVCQLWKYSIPQLGHIAYWNQRVRCKHSFQWFLDSICPTALFTWAVTYPQNKRATG